MPGLGAILQNDVFRWAAASVLGCALAAVAGFLIWRALRSPLTAEEIERRRRDKINREGKIGDGEIVDVEGSVIVYSYSVAGVGYTVAQDAATIESLMPQDRMRMVGPASVRYDPKNPPNSIVLSEDWSGLRLRPLQG